MNLIQWFLYNLMSFAGGSASVGRELAKFLIRRLAAVGKREGSAGRAEPYRVGPGRRRRARPTERSGASADRQAQVQ